MLEQGSGLEQQRPAATGMTWSGSAGRMQFEGQDGSVKDNSEKTVELAPGLESITTGGVGILHPERLGGAQGRLNIVFRPRGFRPWNSLTYCVGLLGLGTPKVEAQWARQFKECV